MTMGLPPAALPPHMRASIAQANGTVPGSRGRKVGGQVAKYAGQHFEQVIDRSATMGSATIVRLIELPPAGGRVVGGGKFIRLPMPFDRLGVIEVAPVRGHLICFDAKSSEDKYGIDLKNDKILKMHQICYLNDAAKSGALAGLLIEARTAERYLWLSGVHLWPRPGFLRWDDPRFLDVGRTGGWVDFSALVKAYAEGKL